MVLSFFISVVIVITTIGIIFGLVTIFAIIKISVRPRK